VLINANKLFSDEYKRQQEFLHETTEYGTAAQHYGGVVGQILDMLEITHLLDYGCGKRMGLLKNLKFSRPMKYQGYDPFAGDPELATAPIPAQMVACIDVLEHIEPQFLDNVLDHIAELTEVVAFMTVHTGPAQKFLQDGRNAHLTQQEMEWWAPKFFSRFDVQSLQRHHDNGFWCIAYAKPRIEAPNGKKLAA
jgi:hypothetical protein